jgi:hypothetical protein
MTSMSGMISIRARGGVGVSVGSLIAMEGVKLAAKRVFMRGDFRVFFAIVEPAGGCGESGSFGLILDTFLRICSSIGFRCGF